MMAFAPRKTESTNTNIAQLKKEPQIIMKTKSMNLKKKTLISIFDDENQIAETKRISNEDEMTVTQFMKNVSFNKYNNLVNGK